MGAGARVANVCAAELVLVRSYGRVRRRTVRSAELTQRYACDLRPMMFSSFEVEALVEIDPHPEARLVDVEEATQPGAVKGDHRGVRVGEIDLLRGRRVRLRHADENG